MLYLSDLPGDILLHVCKHLPLRDIMALSMISKIFYALSLERSVWITALETRRTSRPLPGPSFEDLSACDLPSLRHQVLHTLRLERNWSHSHPRIYGPIKVVMLDAPGFDTIFQIPGTELYALHAPLRGILTCWDAGTAKSLRTIDIGGRVLDVSPGHAEPGRFSMALLVLDHTDLGIPQSRAILIVSVEYGRGETSMDIVFRHKLAPDLSHWAVFLNAEIAGVLSCNFSEQDPTINITACNRKSGKCTIVKSTISHHEFLGHSGTSCWDNHIFILVESDKISKLFCCPSHLLPYNRGTIHPDGSVLDYLADGSPLLPDTVPASFLSRPRGALSADPSYMVPAVSLHILYEEGNPTPKAIHVRFWLPSTARHGGPPRLVHAHSANVWGSLKDNADGAWDLILIPNTGMYVLLCVTNEGRTSLQLVKFNPELVSSSVHELQVPPFIDMDSVASLALDDHRGVVSIVDRRGIIFCIPYA